MPIVLVNSIGEFSLEVLKFVGRRMKTHNKGPTLKAFARLGFINGVFY